MKTIHKAEQNIEQMFEVIQELTQVGLGSMILERKEALKLNYTFTSTTSLRTFFKIPGWRPRVKKKKVKV